jgi:hypothetical protein
MSYDVPYLDVYRRGVYPKAMVKHMSRSVRRALSPSVRMPLIREQSQRLMLTAAHSLSYGLAWAIRTACSPSTFTIWDCDTRGECRASAMEKRTCTGRGRDTVHSNKACGAYAAVALDARTTTCACPRGQGSSDPCTRRSSSRASVHGRSGRRAQACLWTGRAQAVCVLVQYRGCVLTTLTAPGRSMVLPRRCRRWRRTCVPLSMLAIWTSIGPGICSIHASHCRFTMHIPEIDIGADSECSGRLRIWTM